jgi:NAD(P)H dehydrogenase (quinone)
VRVSILFAHAARDSFCHATLEAFLRGLRESKHEYEVADLYRMAFVPTLDELAFARERRTVSSLLCPRMPPLSRLA